MRSLICVVILIKLINDGDSARILGIIPTASFSHQEMFQPLWKELSLRGHQVTVLTTHPIGDPLLTNLTEIDTSSSIHILKDMIPNIIDNSKNRIKVVELSVITFIKVFEEQLKLPEVQFLVNDSTIEFDLLIAEFNLHAPLAFSKRFNCPYIGVLASDAMNVWYELLGNPGHPVAYPDILLGEAGESTLVNRVWSVLSHVAVQFCYKWIFIPYQEDLVLKYFGEKYNLDEIYQNASLVFVNSDPIFYSARPLTPNVITMGGKPLRMSSHELPKDLQGILDSNQRGFIYFSLGTNVNTKDFSPETLSTILDVFKELPYTIVWKYDLVDLPDKPENVVILKWVPQIKILEHPNLKLFITHGGAQSVQEGVFAGVPMLGVPVFVDHPINIQRLVNRGCSLSIDYRTLTASHFKEVILELINNPIYRDQVKKLKSLAEDQPWTLLERTVWWTEYVLRHNGAQHLRSPILNMPFYQYYFLDVIGVFLALLIAAMFGVVVFIKTVLKILRYCWSSKVKVH